MIYWIALIIGAGSLIAQSLVVYYGLRLVKVVGHTEHWSIGWKLYVGAMSVILLRRFTSFLTLALVECDKTLLSYMIWEEVLAIAVSVLLLFFGRELVQLFLRYVFKTNGH